MTAIFLRKKAKQRKKHPRFSSIFHLPDGTSDGTADDTTDDTEDDTEDDRSTDIADGFSDDFQTAIQMTPRRILRLLDAGSPDGGPFWKVDSAAASFNATALSAVSQRRRVKSCHTLIAVSAP